MSGLSKYVQFSLISYGFAVKWALVEWASCFFHPQCDFYTPKIQWVKELHGWLTVAQNAWRSRKRQLNIFVNHHNYDISVTWLAKKTPTWMKKRLVRARRPAICLPPVAGCAPQDSTAINLAIGVVMVCNAKTRPEESQARTGAGTGARVSEACRLSIGASRHACCHSFICAI